MQNILSILAIILPIALFYFVFVKHFNIQRSMVTKLAWTTLAFSWGVRFFYLLLSKPPDYAQAYHPFMLAVGAFCISGLFYQNLPYLKERLRRGY